MQYDFFKFLINANDDDGFKNIVNDNMKNLFGF